MPFPNNFSLSKFSWPMLDSEANAMLIDLIMLSACLSCLQRLFKACKRILYFKLTGASELDSIRGERE